MDELMNTIAKELTETNFDRPVFDAIWDTELSVFFVRYELKNGAVEEGEFNLAALFDHFSDDWAIRRNSTTIRT